MKQGGSDNADSVTPQTPLMLPHVLRLTPKVPEARHVLATMMLRVPRHLHQRFEDGDHTRRVGGTTRVELGERRRSSVLRPRGSLAPQHRQDALSRPRAGPTSRSGSSGDGSSSLMRRARRRQCSKALAKARRCSRLPSTSSSAFLASTVSPVRATDSSPFLRIATTLRPVFDPMPLSLSW